jgi:hypothetical protein
MRLNHKLIACFLIFFSACKSQVRNDFKKDDSAFENIKSEYLQSDLIIGLLVLQQTSNYKIDSIFPDKETFISITKSYFEYDKLDSTKKATALRQLSYKYNSSIMKQDLFSFIDNYKVVTNLIFSNMDDDDEIALENFGNRIMNIKRASEIYRLYVLPKQTIASLTSYTGIALNIHLAYYLSSLDTKERIMVIKQLL